MRTELAPLAAALRLYLVTPQEAVGRRSYAEVVRGALRGGVSAVQLRAKDAPVADQLELGAELRASTRAAGALFVVNDRLDVALALHADGVHLGAEDLPVEEARRLAPRMIVGATVRDGGEARAALAAGASYLGFGAVYRSRTKADSPLGGIEGLRAVVAAAAPLPVVGIGGIGSGRCAAVVAAGAAGVALVEALDAGSEAGAEQAARALRRELGAG